ncbi:MAG: hypothetical protein ABIS25_04925 [Sphingomicrobium sp.]
MRGGKDVWFHFPLPTPVEQGGRPVYLDSVSLLWETMEDAEIGWIVVQHGGMERLPLTERNCAPPFESVPFEVPELWREYVPASDRKLTELTHNPRLPLRFGLQLCVMVRAPKTDGTIRFYGAGAAFSDDA